MSSSGAAMGTLDVALAHAARLLARQPALAAEQATEVLKSVPDSAAGRLILAQACTALGRTDESVALLEALAREQTNSAIVPFELANAYSLAGRLDSAIAAYRTAVRRKPGWPDAWRLLADHLDALGDARGADHARAAFLGAAVNDPRLRAAAGALQSNDLPQSEALLRAHLKEHPTDVAALRMLAEIAGRLRRYRDAQTLLERCIDLAPSFKPAQHQYAVVLFRQGRPEEARDRLAQLLLEDPTNLGYLSLQAAILAQLGNTRDAIAVYETVLRRCPTQGRLWLSYGHVLKSAGKFGDSVAAYQRAIAVEPTGGEAWWSLANLKTFRFDGSAIDSMQRTLERTDLGDEDRLHFEFALGKALEDKGQYERAFGHYASGAAIRRRLHDYNADEVSAHVRRSKQVCVPELFRSRAGQGHPARDPIFIVGMPRSGSTLVEQILASHPLVEGTMELPNIPAFSRELGGPGDAPRAAGYPEALGTLTQEQLHALGTRFLAETRIHRTMGLPYFIDKLPNNFLHVGLIHLILPNAKIIDTRRHPLGCCFSNFKQHFARGQNFSYSLEELGRFYHDYVELMAHYDSVLPGRIHRVHYEKLVDDPESEVRRLLDYCGLAFDGRCLRFYENDRAVRTPSAEQVRQPIFREGLDQWRHFEPWLDPLKASLGAVLDAYPEVPGF